MARLLWICVSPVCKDIEGVAGDLLLLNDPALGLEPGVEELAHLGLGAGEGWRLDELGKELVLVVDLVLGGNPDGKEDNDDDGDGHRHGDQGADDDLAQPA